MNLSTHTYRCPSCSKIMKRIMFWDLQDRSYLNTWYCFHEDQFYIHMIGSPEHHLTRVNTPDYRRASS